MRRLVAACTILAGLVVPTATTAAHEREWPWRAATTWYVAATASDYYTSERGFDVGFIEKNPAMPTRPTDSRFFAQAAVFNVAVWVAARKIRQRHPRAAVWVLIGVGAVHAMAAAHNDRLYDSR
jgi:hypothetical protein